MREQRTTTSYPANWLLSAVLDLHGQVQVLIHRLDRLERELLGAPPRGSRISPTFSPPRPEPGVRRMIEWGTLGLILLRLLPYLLLATATLRAWLWPLLRPWLA